VPEHFSISTPVEEAKKADENPEETGREARDAGSRVYEYESATCSSYDTGDGQSFSMVYFNL